LTFYSSFCVELLEKSSEKINKLKKERKKYEEMLNVKEKELLQVKSHVLECEEAALKYQQDLLVYKRDTEAKIKLLQNRYNEELFRIRQEKLDKLSHQHVQIKSPFLAQSKLVKGKEFEKSME
jgi:chromosome segregation ATPase